MEQKKFFQISSILVAAVWIFCISFIVSTKIADKKSNETTSGIASTLAPATLPSSENFTTTSPSTTAPSASQPSTTAPGGTIPMGGNNVSTTVTVDDPQWLIDQQSSIEASKKQEEKEKDLIKLPEGNKAIAQAYIKGLNELKKEKNVTVSKKPTLDIVVDKMTGGSMVENIATSIVDANKPVEATYTFVNGVDSATGQTPVSAIAPLGKYAELDHSAIKKASAERTVGGGYKLTIYLVDETQTHTSPAPNHDTTMEVIDIGALLPEGATINDLSIVYSGSRIEATFNKDGKITSVYHVLPVTQAIGSGSMKVLLSNITVSMELHGQYTCQYNVSYS